MTDPSRNLRGGKRPNTGGAREGAGRKSNVEKGLPLARIHTVSAKVEADLRDWVEAQGGSAYIYTLLRQAFIEGHIVD